MKKQIVVFSSLIIAAALLIGVVSCKKDEEKVTFALSSLVASSINLNGATPPENVPADPTIVATFNMDVKASTANATNITLTRDYDGADVALTITSSGTSITIVPLESLGNGAKFILDLSGIQSTDDQSLSTITRSFTTLGNFVPSGQIAYWSFEETTDDVIGSYDPLASGIVDLTYSDSYRADAGKCATFNGTSTIVEVPGADALMNTIDFSLSFWAFADSSKHGQFVIGLGAFYGFQFEIGGDFNNCKLAASYNIGDTAASAKDLGFNGDGLTNANGGYPEVIYCKDLNTSSGGPSSKLKNKWVHITYTFSGATRLASLYLNGEKMKVEDFNLLPETNPLHVATGLKYNGTEPDVVNELAFGFIQSRAGTLWDTEPWGGYDFPTANHFKGMLDDVRIFHKALTEQEIDLMYNSEKP